MSLTVRKTGSASLAYQQWADYTVYDNGRAIGRIYEDRATRPALRWFWSITMIGARHTGIRTDGCTPTLEQAKAELQANWRKWLVSAQLAEPRIQTNTIERGGCAQVPGNQRGPAGYAIGAVLPMLGAAGIVLLVLHLAALNAN